MRKLVEGFVHRLGVHCESSAVRDLLEYHGCPFSEEMVFGLDGTFGFLYWKRRDMVPPLGIGGKIAIFPHRLPLLLGFEVKKGTTRSKKRAWERAKELIDNDLPVLLQVDMAYLDYMSIPKDGEHFGGHIIVFCGYDEEKGEAYLADSKFEGLQVVPLESLAQARDSRYKPFPPRNSWYELAFPQRLKPLDEAMRAAIEETVDKFLNPPMKFFGIRGVLCLADEILRWPDILPAPLLRPTLHLGYVWIEEAGTGGGLFRRLFARFLKEASDLLTNEGIGKASDLIGESADNWTKVGHTLLRASKAERKEEIEVALVEARVRILECAEIEDKAFRLLEGCGDETR